MCVQKLVHLFYCVNAYICIYIRSFDGETHYMYYNRKIYLNDLMVNFESYQI